LSSIQNYLAQSLKGRKLRKAVDYAWKTEGTKYSNGEIVDNWDSDNKGKETVSYAEVFKFGFPLKKGWGGLAPAKEEGFLSSSLEPKTEIRKITTRASTIQETKEREQELVFIRRSFLKPMQA